MAADDLLIWKIAQALCGRKGEKSASRLFFCRRVPNEQTREKMPTQNKMETLHSLNIEIESKAGQRTALDAAESCSLATVQVFSPASIICLIEMRKFWCKVMSLCCATYASREIKSA